MKRFWPLLLLVAGVLLVLGGFAYDVLCAGIPYQDPTPEQSARYAYHARVASCLRGAGLAALLAGAVAGLVRRMTRKPRGG
jgi:hypothetical protein